MEMTPENQQVVKVLNALIGGRVKVGLEKFPVAIVNEYHLTSENIGVNEGMEILHQLRMKEYLSILTDKDFQQYEDDFEKALNWVLRYLRKRRGVSQVKIKEAMKKLLWRFGFDTESKDFFEKDDPKELEDWNRTVSNHVLEKQFKSPEVEKYRINKNLFDLREKLRRGKDFYNMSKDFLTYDSENFDLYIGEHYVNIKPREDIPAGHFILKHIIDHGKKDTYSLDEMRDARVIPSSYDMNTLKKYEDAARGITRKVNQQTKLLIPDFLKVTKGTVKIREKYTL